MLTHLVRSTLPKTAIAVIALGSALAQPLQAAEPGSLDTLIARVQLLEDREEIRALILAYGAAHDHRDYRTFANLFAQEGEWVGGLGTAKGPDAIFALMDKSIGHNPIPPGTASTVHLMTNDQISIDGDTASATTKWMFVTPDDSNAPKVVVVGHYDDKFIRENGTWKFLRREAPGDIPVPKR